MVQFQGYLNEIIWTGGVRGEVRCIFDVVADGDPGESKSNGANLHPRRDRLGKYSPSMAGAFAYRFLYFQFLATLATARLHVLLMAYRAPVTATTWRRSRPLEEKGAYSLHPTAGAPDFPFFALSVHAVSTSPRTGLLPLLH